MLSSSLSCISCYLKASCFRPKPLQKHQQPPMEKKVFFTIPPSKLSKFEQNSTNIKISKSISKKYQKSRFFDHFDLPNPSQNPSKTFLNQTHETSWPPLGPSWALLATKPLKNKLRSAAKDANELPKPFQNLPKNRSKPLQNQLKNACEKKVGFLKRFF